MRLIDEQYTRTPFYGSRRMVVALDALGYPVNRKRVQRLMRVMGLEGVAPGPRTGKPQPQHKVYPYPGGLKTVGARQQQRHRRFR